jgi:hypothetical protein
MKTGIRGQHSPSGEAPKRKWGLVSGVSYGVVVASIAIAGLAFPETAVAGENDPGPFITVQIYNYSKASPGVLTGAEREAARILGQASLRTVWFECPVGPSAANPQGRCNKVPEATDIRLRVLAAPSHNEFQDTVFGFTIHPVYASVYYEYAVHLAKSHDEHFDVPIILGSVIAHELGHLLLGSNSHSSAGIMQAQWDLKQLRETMMNRLLFTSEQSKLMQAQARTRIRASGRKPGPRADSAE